MLVDHTNDRSLIRNESASFLVHFFLQEVVNDSDNLVLHLQVSLVVVEHKTGISENLLGFVGPPV